jgi:hypothetical protein
MAATAFIVTAVVLVLLQVIMPAISGSDEEAAALLSFKRASVAHDPRRALAGWANSTDAPCNWAGVSCARPPNGRVVVVNLRGMALAGKLRLDALLTLPALRRLDLRGNAFHGNLSHAAAAATSCALEEVDVSSNAFTGTLPASFLAACSALRSLNRSRNALAGGGFPFAPSLRTLDLSRNNLTDAGLLDHSLAGCHGLRHLNLSGNALAGRMPELATCSGDLAVLDVSWNHMSGALPEELVAAVPANLSIAGNC